MAMRRRVRRTLFLARMRAAGFVCGILLAIGAGALAQDAFTSDTLIRTILVPVILMLTGSIGLILRLAHASLAARVDRLELELRAISLHLAALDAKLGAQSDGALARRSIGAA